MPVYTFGTFDDPSASTPSTFAHGINGMGQIVGSYFNSGVRHGYLLTGGAFTMIDDPLGAHTTEASGINGTGQIAGYYIDAGNNFHGFFLTGGTYITVDDPLGTQGTQAFVINASAQIVGIYAVGSSQHGFLYNPVGGTYDAPDHLIAPSSRARVSGSRPRVASS
jgi:uncharacterized membrane protein